MRVLSAEPRPRTFLDTVRVSSDRACALRRAGCGGRGGGHASARAQARAFAKRQNQGNAAVPLRRRLIAFERVSLDVGEIREVEFPVRVTDFALANDDGDEIAHPGTYHLEIEDGSGAKETTSLDLTGEAVLVRPFPMPEAPKETGTVSAVKR